MKIRNILISALLYLCLATSTAQAFQVEDVRLNVRRSFGYSSGNQIRGTFSMDIIGNVNIQLVKYYIDDQLIGEVSKSPFGISFQTTSYANGWHDLSAVVMTSDNRALKTIPRRFEFVSSEAEGQAVSSMLFPLLGGIAAVMILGTALQIFLFQKKGLNKLPPGAPRKYGWQGGTICPKCKRPFSIHMYGINLLAGKLDRCDYCGKWSVITRKSSQELAAAEANEVVMAQPSMPIEGKSQSEKMKDLIEDSKYLE